MSWTRRLCIVAALIAYAALLYALWPGEADGTAYRLLYAVLLVVPVVLFLILRRRIIRVVRTGELGIIERTGRFLEVAQPGLILLCPLLETLRVLPTSEQAHLCTEQNVVTADGVPIGAKMLVRYRLEAATRDAAYAATYAVSDWQSVVRSQAVAALHQQVGKQSVDDMLKNWTALGEPIRQSLASAAATWGVEVVGVDLHGISIPESLRVALEDEQKAEIEAKAAEYRAGGQVERIRQVLQVLEKAGLDAVLTERYIQALETMSTNPSSHIILPVDVMHGLRGLAHKPSPDAGATHDTEETRSNSQGTAAGSAASGKTSQTGTKNGP